MEFNYSYKGNSKIDGEGDNTQMSFSPDTTREPTFFRGSLRQNINFREAISALHDVVISDLRFKPKDKTAYKEWAAERDKYDVDWQLVAAQKKEVAVKIQAIQAELQELYKSRSKRWEPFYKAQAKYFEHLYKRDYDAWFVLDPVITVHPDEVFFECFSQDESSYGRLSASYEVFHNINEFECGTTNIDYSAALYDEFQKIRSNVALVAKYVLIRGRYLSDLTNQCRLARLGHLYFKYEVKSIELVSLSDKNAVVNIELLGTGQYRAIMKKPLTELQSISCPLVKTKYGWKVSNFFIKNAVPVGEYELHDRIFGNTRSIK